MTCLCQTAQNQTDMYTNTGLGGGGGGAASMYSDGGGLAGQPGLPASMYSDGGGLAGQPGLPASMYSDGSGLAGQPGLPASMYSAGGGLAGQDGGLGSISGPASMYSDGGGLGSPSPQIDSSVAGRPDAMYSDGGLGSPVPPASYVGLESVIPPKAPTTTATTATIGHGIQGVGGPEVGGLAAPMEHKPGVAAVGGADMYSQGGLGTAGVAAATAAVRVSLRSPPVVCHLPSETLSENIIFILPPPCLCL